MIKGKKIILPLHFKKYTNIYASIQDTLHIFQIEGAASPIKHPVYFLIDFRRRFIQFYIKNAIYRCYIRNARNIVARIQSPHVASH